ncbi:MAG: transaldolase [Acidiferrobacteraceae bacterium]|jgi:transaldolase|nr:transaldolase [Acidiferrobacteraceae bacterium]MDP6397415.1 transaldolase [Arenicellales bacterium]MDP6551713.1 transaldolase [Arenicellales bacterium]MDP6791497.1 transaldolase [Arenicellales bacterium]MDP6918134.1 transaldolase [Arenicellales bacterium]|tara:strand:+ start:9351 stop:10067 length:717 start_codon:yes stop_codon:yes gene_type:complete
MSAIDKLKVKLFADGADRVGMLEMYQKPYIQGFTTNPTLMKKAGISDYEGFAHEILQEIPDRPISFEVFADEFDEMERQALKIRTWGENVYVKIPVSNTRQEMSYGLIERLSGAGVHLNITAILTLDQVGAVAQAVRNGPASVVSVFAGRIADTGLDPVPIMSEALDILATAPLAELLWASPREVLNIYQADAIGCHIITATNDIIRKLSLSGKDLADYSLETVQMFYDDADRAGYKL